MVVESALETLEESLVLTFSCSERLLCPELRSHSIQNELYQQQVHTPHAASLNPSGYPTSMCSGLCSDTEHPGDPEVCLQF